MFFANPLGVVRFAIHCWAKHEGLKDREEQAAVLRHLALLFDLIRLDPDQSIFRKCRERMERLIGQNVTIGQEQDARSASRFAARFPVGQIPATLEQLPLQLKRDESFAGSGSQSVPRPRLNIVPAARQGKIAAKTVPKAPAQMVIRLLFLWFSPP